MPTNSPSPLNITILGLTITSSWGNGHATTYRGLVRELSRRGHHVTFLEHDKPWYAGNRDMPNPPWGHTFLYSSLEQLQSEFESTLRQSDVVIVGSYTPHGTLIGDWVTSLTAHSNTLSAFYDIDTPVTLAKLAREDYEYIAPDLIARYDLYLSFTGGPTLDVLQNRYHSPRALPLYCSVDPELYYPEHHAIQWDLGYLGTYSDDRQPTLDRLLIQPALQWHQGRFIVVGPQYPATIAWPRNVTRIIHLSPAEHRAFYNAQRFTLNITRADMIKAGYAPSVRLFEAAACGIPILSDPWPGLETFFHPNHEILIARTPFDTLQALKDLSEQDRQSLGTAARKKALAHHTAAHRAQELESYILNYTPNQQPQYL